MVKAYWTHRQDVKPMRLPRCAVTTLDSNRGLARSASSRAVTSTAIPEETSDRW